MKKKAKKKILILGGAGYVATDTIEQHLLRNRDGNDTALEYNTILEKRPKNHSVTYIICLLVIFH